MKGKHSFVVTIKRRRQDKNDNFQVLNRPQTLVSWQSIYNLTVKDRHQFKMLKRYTRGIE